jgi:hypothetical protein
MFLYGRTWCFYTGGHGGFIREDMVVLYGENVLLLSLSDSNI